MDYNDWILNARTQPQMDGGSAFRRDYTDWDPQYPDGRDDTPDATVPGVGPVLGERAQRFETTVCRSANCDARIVWARSSLTGRPIPVDAEPHPDGNVFLYRDRELGVTAQVLTRAAAAEGTGLHRSHFASCPDADGWRK